MTKVGKVIPIQFPSVTAVNRTGFREKLEADLRQAWIDFRQSNLTNERMELPRYLAEGYSLLTRDKEDHKFLGLKKADLEIYQRIILGINNLRIFDLKDDETAFWIGKGLSGVDDIIQNGGIQDFFPEDTKVYVSTPLIAVGDICKLVEDYILIGIPKKLVLERGIDFDIRRERFVLNRPIPLNDFSEVIYRKDGDKEFFQTRLNDRQPIFVDRTKERVTGYTKLELEHISGILPYVFDERVHGELSDIFTLRGGQAKHGLIGHAFRMIDAGLDLKHGLLVPNELLFLVGALNPISGESLPGELASEISKLINDVNSHEIINGHAQLNLDHGVQACKEQAKALLVELARTRQKNELVNLALNNGFVQFSVEAAICEARKNELDEGKYISELLGINPEIVKPGMKFVYHRGFDGQEGSEESFTIYNINHSSGNSLSSEGIEEMLTNKRESMLDKYRVYYAGKGFPSNDLDKETLRYLTHQIGHDVWFASLTNEKRNEFIKLLKEAVLDYKTRTDSDAFLGEDRSFDKFTEERLLSDKDKFENVSEAFALAFGRHAGFPILSDGRPFYYYIHNQKSDEIFKPFFDSMQMRMPSSKQSSCLDFIHRNQKQIASAGRVLKDLTKSYYEIAEEDKNFKPLFEYVQSRVICDLFMNGPQMTLDSLIDSYIKLPSTRPLEPIMSIILNAAE